MPCPLASLPLLPAGATTRIPSTAQTISHATLAWMVTLAAVLKAAAWPGPASTTLQA